MSGRKTSSAISVPYTKRDVVGACTALIVAVVALYGAFAAAASAA